MAQPVLAPLREDPCLTPQTSVTAIMKSSTVKSLNCITRRHSSGFTMIEIAVVLALLGIVFAIVAPNFRRSFDRARFDRAQSELQSDIRLAISTARAKGRAVRFNFSATGYSLADAADSTQVYRSRDYGDGFMLATDRNPLVFPWGQVQPVQIQVSNHSYSQDFRVLPTGRVEESN